MAAKPKTALAPAPLVAITKEDPNLLQLIANAGLLRGSAVDYVIDSREMYELGTTSLTDIRNAEKAVEAKRLEIAEPLHKAWKNTNALFKPISDALEGAKRTLSSKLVAFEDQERARIKAAEQVAEMRRQAEIDAAAAKMAETTAKLETGEATLEDFQAAATEVALAEVTAPVMGAVDPVSRGGHARRDRYVVDQINDIPAFLEYLAKSLRAEDPTFNNTVEFKLGQLNAFAQATEGSAKIPGVTFRKESTLAARGS